MSQEGFPSQDPEQLAETLASDAYHAQRAEEAQRKADEAAAEAARQAQEQRLEKWFTGGQENARDLKKYLDSRPYEDEKGIHAPSGEVVEPVNAGTWGRKNRPDRNQWGNRYFEGQRSKRYEQTHDDPAELSAFKLFDRFIDAEIEGDKTFMEDYGKILAEKLNDRDVTPFELADLLADAEHDSEVKGSDVPRTTDLLSRAIDGRVRDFHNRTSGKVKQSYEMHDADGKLRTVSPMEYEAARTDAYRARIMKEKESYLAELREKSARQSEDETPVDPADYEPDWVMVDDREIPEDRENGHDADEPDDEGGDDTGAPEDLTPETEILPEDEAEKPEHEHEAAEDDELFDGEPQTEEGPAADENTRFAKFKQGVRKHLREHPIKEAPPKPEGYEHPLDKFDRLYTFPFKAKVNGRAAELRDSIKRAAERGMERHEFLRRAGHVGQIVVNGALELPQKWDEYLIEMSQVPQDDEAEAPTEETATVNSPVEQVESETASAPEEDAASDEEQTVGPEGAETSKKKAGRVSRILRNLRILSDEVREGTRRQQEESEEKSEDE